MRHRLSRSILNCPIFSARCTRRNRDHDSTRSCIIICQTSPRDRRALLQTNFAIVAQDHKRGRVVPTAFTLFWDSTAQMASLTNLRTNVVFTVLGPKVGDSITSWHAFAAPSPNMATWHHVEKPTGNHGAYQMHAHKCS